MAERIKLFTHTDLDGIGCAIVAGFAFGFENVDVTYCNYDDVNSVVEEFFKSGKDREYYRVYITDISIRDGLADEIDRYGCGNWFLFDHHGTALSLNKYDWCTVETDVSVTEYASMRVSGTWLLYRELSNGDRSSLISGDLNDEVQLRLMSFVELVKDYDTWRWKEVLREDHGLICKQVNDLFYIYGRNEFIEWAKKLILEGDGEDFKIGVFGEETRVWPTLSETDRKVLENRQKEIDRYIEKKNKELVIIQDRFGYLFGVVFAENYFSELGNRLSEIRSELDYIAMIDISGGKVSYRTAHDDIDLGKEIAHHYGGGGHAKAAGSTFGEEVQMLVFCDLFSEGEEEGGKK